MFDFGRANDAQRQAISTTNGPVLITAGPGTGKTFTLVQRTVYLIEQCGVAPEQIMVATFTEKAAKELVTRITNELDARGISVNLTEMYVGTFHSLCLRILKENLEYTRLKQGFKVLDEFDQAYTVFQSFHRFKSIDGYDNVLGKGGTWRKAGTLCTLVNNLAEELVDPQLLLNDKDPDLVSLGHLTLEYRKLLQEQNLLDFASIQVEAHRLLIDHPQVAQKLSEQLQYLMIDEYQDTNYVQEQLVFILGGNNSNICVVGDDDQGLYRFRGATIRNILEFPDKFPQGQCTIIPLVTNYRSDAQIVDFYNTWMTTTEDENFDFDWGTFRYDKTITPAAPTPLSSPSVISLGGSEDPREWHREVLAFIRTLEASGKLTDYNQLAFLFRSVKHPKVKALASYLEDNGINVYSPRSEMFFKRKEIMLAIGLLLVIFPLYVKSLQDDESPATKFLKPDQIDYYVKCINTAKAHLATPEAQDLKGWLVSKGREHATLTGQTDYAIAALFYQMLAFEPFASMITAPMDSGLVDLRPARNIARLTQIIGKFEFLHDVSILSARKSKGCTERHIDRTIDQFFTLYMRLLMEGGIGEYEDDSEYAPSGCVSFLTIHQSKGMEFPIVFVDSLHSFPRKEAATIMDDVEAKYFHREPFEPEDQIKYFDFWRVYYTAFSRAQNLLVLTCNEDNRTPSKYFRTPYRQLPNASDPAFKLEEFTFDTVKGVNLKEKYSFTSHISVYETCPRQYKFYRELEFAPVRVTARMFGTLVHQTIEDVHRAALRGEEALITEDNVVKWFDANYTYLSRAERAHLAPAQRKSAIGQVQRYVARQDGRWEQIKQAEVDVSLVKPEYIVDGTIDLIRGQDGTVEIVDFKSEKKPDLNSNSKWHRDRLERYRRQLHLYAHLVHERTGETVSKMHVYYTGEEDSNPQITWDYSPTAIEATMEVFDETVHKIMAKEYSGCARSAKTCGTCDFLAYCSRQPGKPTE